jgi:hypothetical protein
MMLGVYVTPDIFLLPAAREPIGSPQPDCFHGMVELFPHRAYGSAGFRNLIACGELWGVAVLVVIGVALIVLAPAKKSGDRASAAVLGSHSGEMSIPISRSEASPTRVREAAIATFRLSDHCPCFLSPQSFLSCVNRPPYHVRIA